MKSTRVNVLLEGVFGAIVALMVISSGAQAADAILKADLQMITHDAESGVCAAWVVARQDSPDQLSDLPDCNVRWVNLDCSNDFIASKAATRLNFDLVTAAQITQRPLNLVVTNDYKLDTGRSFYCTATTVQLFRGN